MLSVDVSGPLGYHMKDGEDVGKEGIPYEESIVAPSAAAAFVRTS